MKFIQYNLSGEVVKQYSTDFNKLKAYPLGEKVRITLNDETVYIGFWDTWLGQETIKVVDISRYDLDENTSKLRSGNQLTTFVPTSEIVKIEAILYSNPRWGTRPTNNFEFSNSGKMDPELDQLKNLPKK